MRSQYLTYLAKNNEEEFHSVFNQNKKLELLEFAFDSYYKNANLNNEDAIKIENEKNKNNTLSITKLQENDKFNEIFQDLFACG